jgi:thiol-disulfide isomerase/thioredoxin
MRFYWLLFLMCWAPSTSFSQDVPELDARGWHIGEIAAGTGSLLTPMVPVEVDLPTEIKAAISTRTLVFYFSPSCPHCTAVMPSLVSFSQKPNTGLAFLGVATAQTSPEDLAAYRKKYQVDFPMQIDKDRGYATALGLRSTPAGILIEPSPSESSGEKWLAISGFVPWFEGAEHLLEMQLNPNAPFSSFGPDQYIGQTVCAACHRSEADSGSLTHHTIAYATLYLRDKAEDTACVGCHVTGLDAGGFKLGDHQSDFAGVTCESCHSPGGPHDGKASSAKESCTGCHDADHSIAFSYEKGLPFLDHYKAQNMNEAQIKARWAALQSGEAERPLLAFPTGNSVGAESCKSCHTQEHARWTAGPHTRAGATLAAHPDGQDPDCQRCHSTPAAFGLGAKPTEHLKDSGVSCESCHGPGQAHIQAPTKQNIIALGESCPECIIEEICTSCHTPKWDANWSLDVRLKHLRDLYQPKTEK